MYKFKLLLAYFIAMPVMAQNADSTGANRLLIAPVIASEGSACATNAVKTDSQGNVLRCVNGSWVKDSVGSGLRGLLAPYRNKSAGSCDIYGSHGNMATISAFVDNNAFLNVTILQRHGKTVTCIDTATCGMNDYTGSYYTVITAPVITASASADTCGGGDAGYCYQTFTCSIVLPSN